MSADASGRGGPPAKAPGLHAGGVRGFARDFFTDVGSERATPRRLRVGAWVRLLLIVPFVLVPTGITLVVNAERGYAVATTMWLSRVWLIAASVLVIADLGVRGGARGEHGGRLESACEPGRVLVGEETARLLDPDVAVEPAGDFRLKGISEPVRAYVAAEGARGPV